MMLANCITRYAAPMLAPKADDRTPAPHAEALLIGRGSVEHGAVNVVGPHSRERADIPRHAGHEAGDQCGDADAQEAGAEISGHHQRHHFVEAVTAGGERFRLAGQCHREHGQPQQAGQNDDGRQQHLECRADRCSHLRGPQIARGHHSLDNQEIRGPIAEGADKAQAEDDSGPVHAHRVVRRRAHVPPHVRVVLAGARTGDARKHSAPTASFDQAEYRDRQRSQPR